MVAVTPMIGSNDDPAEVFTVADAQKVTAWASTHQIGMIGMWSLGRDTATGYDFAKAFEAFIG